MNVGDIARTVFAIQIVLDDVAGRFIVTGNTFSQLGDEGIESQYFRIAIDSIY